VPGGASATPHLPDLPTPQIVAAKESKKTGKYAQASRKGGGVKAAQTRKGKAIKATHTRKATGKTAATAKKPVTTKKAATSGPKKIVLAQKPR